MSKITYKLGIDHYLLNCAMVFVLYKDAISAANISSTLFRFTFIVGVNKPFSIVNPSLER